MGKFLGQCPLHKRQTINKENSRLFCTPMIQCANLGPHMGVGVFFVFLFFVFFLLFLSRSEYNYIASSCKCCWSSSPDGQHCAYSNDVFMVKLLEDLDLTQRSPVDACRT